MKERPSFMRIVGLLTLLGGSTFASMGALYGNPSKAAVGVVFSGLMIVGGALLMWNGRQRTITAEQPGDDLLILESARRRRGRVSAFDVASDTGLNIELVEPALDRLVQKGLCEILSTNAGQRMYRFADFETDVAPEVKKRERQSESR
ncbi:MAG: hypothetical protein IT381_14405 [Deltaproteobacteria bacterium]|nr:hypothetical protein [Deltaproteobacteria bacterium]